jgi:hypothetical protein
MHNEEERREAIVPATDHDLVLGPPHTDGEITGRSLASTETLAETWLALRAAATLPAR